MTTFALLLVSFTAYVVAYIRVRRAGRAFPWRAVAAFEAGLIVVAASLLGPIDARADASLAWHMVQHLALVTVAAPLLL
nr:cytochrome c oxidase assembly protein [Candidatus Eremiobacteraeota bacterium]